MTTAVVLSTYNGEKYIYNQLLSLKNQTRPINKVYISDDCSQDNTYEIIEKFISENKLSNWILKKNEENIGWKKSFFNLTSSVTEDITFFADQDDIWASNKIEIMTYWLEKNLDINVLVTNNKTSKFPDCNYTCSVDKDINPIQIPFSGKCFYIQNLGCCYGFKTSFFNAIKNYYVYDTAHDAFLYIFGMFTDSLFLLPAELIIHRIHDKNTGNEYLKKLKQIPMKNVEIVNSMLKYIESETLNNAVEKKQILEQLLSFFELKIQFYQKGKIKLFFELYKYRMFYISFKNYIKEIFIYLKR